MQSGPFLPEELRQSFHNFILYFQGGTKLTIVIAIAVSMLVVPASKGLRQGWRQWNKSVERIALTAGCFFLWGFIIYFGNLQFGAWDFSIAIDPAWRQILGQRPYRDIVSPNPPGFELGGYYAFKLLGVRWSSLVYATSTMACISFLWMYWLFRRLNCSQLIAFVLSMTIEAACVLTLCFWWYNDEVAIAATVFLLSCMAYVQQPDDRRIHLSYTVSLALLPLMKPNIAGVVLILCLVLAFLTGKRRRRLLALTLTAFLFTLLILLVHHISLPAMIETYRAISIERGFSHFGFIETPKEEKTNSLIWLWVLALPLIAAIPSGFQRVRDRQWRWLLYLFFLPAMLIVSRYGMYTDGELKQVELGVVIASGGAIIYGLLPVGRWIRTLYAISLLTLATVCVVVGASRLRVERIGYLNFYYFARSDFRPSDGFFKGLRASKRMGDAVSEAQEAAARSQGPIFFGPRLEFCYAAFHLSSPPGLPVYWQPGTSFARRDESAYQEVWKAHQFPTLIFLRDEYAFYSPEFKQYILDHYQPEDHQMTTIWRLKASQQTSSPPSKQDDARMGRIKRQ